MRSIKVSLSLALLVLAAACVTINVYFPAAAAEQAADKIIDEVWGGDADQVEEEAPPESGLPMQSQPLALRVLSFIVPAAHAQSPDIDVSSPAIKKIEASMKARHSNLAGFYASGALGLTGDGLVAVRDPKAAPLKDRKKLTQLAAEENRDRNALYQAIARENGHPEWEPQIRSTFAKRWISKAGGGWYYQAGGAWKQK